MDSFLNLYLFPLHNPDGNLDKTVQDRSYVSSSSGKEIYVVK